MRTKRTKLNSDEIYPLYGTNQKKVRANCHGQTEKIDEGFQFKKGKSRSKKGNAEPIEQKSKHQKNKTPTVRGLAANNNNMQNVLMRNMETI